MYDVDAVARLAQRINSGTQYDPFANMETARKGDNESQIIELDYETRSCTTQSAGEIIDTIRQQVDKQLSTQQTVDNQQPIQNTVDNQLSTQQTADNQPAPKVIAEAVGSLPPSTSSDYRSAIKRGAYDSHFEGDVSATWLMELNIEPMEYLLEPLLPRCGLVSLVGSSDSGKSSFLRGLAIAVSAGREEHIGLTLHTRSQRVIYVSTEDDSRAVATLLHKQNEELGLTRGELAGLRFVFNTEDLLKKLDLLLSEHTHDLVILDAFSDLFQGALNENNKVRGFLQDYHDLAQRHGCLIMFLHHTGKRTEALMPSKHNSIGSQGFEAKMRLMMELRSDLHNPRLRHLCVVKGNYLPSEWKQKSIVLHFSENLNFTNTGEREEFHRLRQVEPDSKSMAQEEKYVRVMNMLAEGKSYREVADIMGYKSKASITKIVRSHQSEAPF